MKKTTFLVLVAFLLLTTPVIISASACNVYNNYCNNYYGACNSHAYKDCSGNHVYWFDSCGARQDLAQVCGYNQACKYGECVVKYTPVYNKQPQAINVAVNFFSSKNQNSTAWDKTVEVGQNGTVYFFATVKNNSNSDINNLTIKANIPQEVALVGNLKIDGQPASGDIISGVATSLLANSQKQISFDGKTQMFSVAGSKQATLTASFADKQQQTDSLTINFNTSEQEKITTTTESASADNAFVEFLKRWYLWILVAIILVFLFIVIFRRLSQN